MENQEFQQHAPKWMERMEERVNRQLGALEQDVSWIQGKLEGRSELSRTLQSPLAPSFSSEVC